MEIPKTDPRTDFEPVPEATQGQFGVQAPPTPSFRDQLDIPRLLESPRTQIVISVLLGAGLATFFRKSCAGPNCYVVKYLEPNMLLDRTWYEEGKCYEMVEEKSDGL